MSDKKKDQYGLTKLSWYKSAQSYFFIDFSKKGEPGLWIWDFLQKFSSTDGLVWIFCKLESGVRENQF
jgi:hypothetical protein